MMSLDWILIKKGITDDFTVENCDGYIEYNEETFDEYLVGDYCYCFESGNWYDVFNCGECGLSKYNQFRVDSCDGYELCGDTSNPFDCCSKREYYITDESGNHILDDEGNKKTEIKYTLNEFQLYEYILYRNKDLMFSDGGSGGGIVEGNWVYEERETDIFIPYHLNKSGISNCFDSDEYGVDYCEFIKIDKKFNPNCEKSLDTTMMIGSKSVSFENMGWFDRNNSFGYIHYYPLDGYLFTDDGNEDISNYRVVDYQRKE